TLYGHASSLYVGAGEVVQSGQPLAATGSTGNSTGPHLHFEVRKQGVPVNPLPFLP
ncbi:MAG TPA: M23 family metallopeptidase, partial [Negativicutes bacterium]|nr:M23 family metallopeptidase [Negativicutes bacterium]